MRKVVEKLKMHWREVRKEGEGLRGKVRWMEEEGLVEEGGWEQVHLLGPGVGRGGAPSAQEVCSHAPSTCALLRSMEGGEEEEGEEGGGLKALCPTCTAKWSILRGNTTVTPHCGPTNARCRTTSPNQEGPAPLETRPT